MSQHHVVSCRPEHCHWGFFDAALKPVLALESGDTVQVDCVSGGPDIVPKGDNWEILDDHLAKHRYMVGDTYTIVDMNVWGWARMLPNVVGEGAWDKYKNLKRLVDEISARPAAPRAIALKDKFAFKSEMDDEARNYMFGHLKTKVA